MTHSTVWHPFTQHALEHDIKRIVKTEGAYLYDETGNAIFDGISSWWVVTHGHRYPPIMQAIRKACDHLDQIIFAEYTHEPAELLAQALISIAPTGLKHVFYTDSGSTAVEVALKMALGFYRHSAKPRSRIVVMQHAYHGDTIGSMSLGERGVFNSTYEPLLFEVDRLPFPAPGYEQQTLDAFERFCATNQVAALLVEPLILGAGGFKLYTPFVLSELRRIAKQYDCLFIADEVMTGWGRTGHVFACDKANIAPDILCTSKGLTGGTVPLAATLCTHEIYAAHYSTDRRKTFYHSSSYTANPIACAAAYANIKVWRTEPVRERIRTLEALHQQQLTALATENLFVNIRQLGTIAAMDIKDQSPGYLSTVGPKLRQFFKQNNKLIRPLGNVIYLMTPYCVTAAELNDMYTVIREAATMITRENAA